MKRMEFLDALRALDDKYRRKDCTYRYWSDNDCFESELEELLENALEDGLLTDYSMDFNVTQKTPYFTTGVLLWCAVDDRGDLFRDYYNVLTKTNYVKGDE